MDTTNKEVGEWEGVGRVGGLMMPLDTADQVLCTVGQTYGHSSPDHTTRRADIEWNSLGPQAILLMHSSGLIGSELILHGLIGLGKSLL